MPQHANTYEPPFATADRTAAAVPELIVVVAGRRVSASDEALTISDSPAVRANAHRANPLHLIPSPFASPTKRDPTVSAAARAGNLIEQLPNDANTLCS